MCDAVVIVDLGKRKTRERYEEIEIAKNEWMKTVMSKWTGYKKGMMGRRTRNWQKAHDQWIDKEKE